jgi:hypothetical protein
VEEVAGSKPVFAAYLLIIIKEQQPDIACVYFINQQPVPDEKVNQQPAPDEKSTRVRICFERFNKRCNLIPCN